MGLVAAAGPLPADGPRTPPPGYKIVWADEFDGAKVNEADWVYRTTQREKVSICLPRNVSLEDGKLKIALKKEDYKGIPFTCGGLITKQRYHYGYYEVSAKMDGGRGWHEAFWTTHTDDFNLSPSESVEPRIEIDVFEHYANHDAHEYSFGTIEWYPIKGGISRDLQKTEPDLAKTFNTFGFEITPDYLAYYFNGQMTRAVDLRDLPQNKFHLWLTCIATQLDATPSGAAWFDYLRCYSVDFNSPQYKQRRDALIAKLDKEQGGYTVGSKGHDIWAEAEDFSRPGGWKIERDSLATVLRGHTGVQPTRAWNDLVARSMFSVLNAGQYRLWVRSRDFATNQPGKRSFRVAVEGKLAPSTFGTHGQEGYAWEDGGVFTLPEGLITVELIDSAQYHARVDRLLLTSDLNYKPTSLGARKNAEHWYDEKKLKAIEPLK
jgi:beta-glucanase (GH16 family)